MNVRKNNQDLIKRLEEIMLLDGSSLVDMSYNILISTIDFSYFRDIEVRLLAKGKTRNLKEDSTFALLLAFNYITEKSFIEQIKGVNAKVFFLLLETLLNRLLGYHARRRRYNLLMDEEKKYLVVQKKDFNLIKKELTEIAQNDLGEFLGIIYTSIYVNGADLLFGVDQTVDKRGKVINAYQYLTLCLAACVSLLEEDIIKDQEDNPYRRRLDNHVLDTILAFGNRTIKGIYEVKVKALAEEKRQKQFQNFMKDDFEKYDEVYKVLS